MEKHSYTIHSYTMHSYTIPISMKLVWAYSLLVEPEGYNKSIGIIRSICLLLLKYSTGRRSMLLRGTVAHAE